MYIIITYFTHLFLIYILQPLNSYITIGSRSRTTRETLNNSLVNDQSMYVILAWALYIFYYSQSKVGASHAEI